MIELLVMVTVVVMLVALLLPAMEEARSSARAIRCLANQKQLAMALQSYCMDWRQRPLPTYDDMIPSPYRYWPECLGTYLNLKIRAGATFDRYEQLPPILVCPTAAEYHPQMLWNTGIPTTYQYGRLDYTFWARRTFQRLTTLRNPSRMVALNDAVGNPATHYFEYAGWAKNRVDAALVVDFRHHEKSAFALVDGHAGLYALDGVANDFNPQQGIAWRAFVAE
jgi:hypothetical protein